MSSQPTAYDLRAYTALETGHPDRTARAAARVALGYACSELGPDATAAAAGLSVAELRVATNTGAACPLPTAVLVEAARRATDAWLAEASVPAPSPVPAPLPAPPPPRGRPFLRIVGGTEA